MEVHLQLMDFLCHSSRIAGWFYELGKQLFRRIHPNRLYMNISGMTLVAWPRTQLISLVKETDTRIV